MKCEYGYDCYYKVGGMCKFYDFSPCNEPLGCFRRIGQQQSAKFALGQVVMTAGVEESIEPSEVTAALSRHMCGNWGDVLVNGVKSAQILRRN